MPVSATANATARSSTRWRAVTRTSPRSVNLSALERKLRRICDTFASSVYSGGTLSGSSKTSATDSFTSSGRSMPRSAPNSRPASNSIGRITILPASILARSSRSFTSSPSASAALRMKVTCRSCSGLSSPSVRSSRMRVSAWIELSGVRNSWRHVGEKARLELVGSSQVIRLLVELGVQRDHAAVGVLQLAVERAQLLLPPAQLVERAQQLLVLSLDLVERIAAAPGVRARAIRRATASAAEKACPPRQQAA